MSANNHSVDLYAILGVEENASRERIKVAYRKASLANHPDRAGDDEFAAGRFRMIQEAYEVLSDPGRRAAYDESRQAATQSQATHEEVVSEERWAPTEDPVVDDPVPRRKRFPLAWSGSVAIGTAMIFDLVWLKAHGRGITFAAVVLALWLVASYLTGCIDGTRLSWVQSWPKLWLKIPAGVLEAAVAAASVVYVVAFGGDPTPMILMMFMAKALLFAVRVNLALHGHIGYRGGVVGQLSVTALIAALSVPAALGFLFFVVFKALMTSEGKLQPFWYMTAESARIRAALLEVVVAFAAYQFALPSLVG